MKVLSLKEPYATLILKGYKKIETRSWKTNYRGKLYIHASLGKLNKDLEINDCIKEVMGNEALNNGYIVCSCDLVDCIYMDEEFINKIKCCDEFNYGVYEIGRYAWILENIKPVVKVKAKGKLNIWEYEGEINEL